MPGITRVTRGAFVALLIFATGSAHANNVTVVADCDITAKTKLTKVDLAAVGEAVAVNNGVVRMSIQLQDATAKKQMVFNYSAAMECQSGPRWETTGVLELNPSTNRTGNAVLFGLPANAVRGERCLVGFGAIGVSKVRAKRRMRFGPKPTVRAVAEVFDFSGCLFDGASCDGPGIVTGKCCGWCQTEDFSSFGTCVPAN
jgi:hypothetical protein